MDRQRGRRLRAAAVPEKGPRSTARQADFTSCGAGSFKTPGRFPPWRHQHANDMSTAWFSLRTTQNWHLLSETSGGGRPWWFGPSVGAVLLLVVRPPPSSLCGAVPFSFSLCSLWCACDSSLFSWWCGSLPFSFVCGAVLAFFLVGSAVLSLLCVYVSFPSLLCLWCGPVSSVWSRGGCRRKHWVAEAEGGNH